MDKIPCWNCDGEMIRFAHDTFYWYYKCPKCKMEKAIPREDRKPITLEDI